MTATQSAQKKIDGILTRAEQERSELAETINGYRAQVETAAAAMETAEDSLDLNAYNAAREDKRRAEGALEMYQRRASKLEGAPLMTSEEYQSLRSGIREEIDTYFENLEKELFEVSQRLETLRDEAEAKVKAANKVLEVLQRDIYRDPNYNSHISRDIATRAQWEVVNWAGRMDEVAIYQTMKKSRGV